MRFGKGWNVTHLPCADPTATAFLASLRTLSALEAMSLARDAMHEHGWTTETQQAVTSAILRMFGERKARRLVGRVVTP
jgi:hypothetical protein